MKKIESKSYKKVIANMDNGMFDYNKTNKAQGIDPSGFAPKEEAKITNKNIRTNYVEELNKIINSITPETLKPLIGKSASIVHEHNLRTDEVHTHVAVFTDVLKAKQFGVQESRNEFPKNYTTKYDVVQITPQLLQNPQFVQGIKTRIYHMGAVYLKEKGDVLQENDILNLLPDVMKQIKGIKFGLDTSNAFTPRPNEKKRSPQQIREDMMKRLKNMTGPTEDTEGEEWKNA